MATRHHTIASSVLDQENRKNQNAKPAKAHLGRQISLASRPALNELGKNALKKPEVVKEVKKKVTVREIAPVKKELPRTVSNSARQLETIIDPDADNKDEPQMVAEYVSDIYQHLRELELKFPIRENFLEGHQSSPKMRAILVNWLVQVHSNFKLCLETLYLCVSIIDRYLQDNKEIGRETLQLVGTSSLMVACKYEEMYLPDLRDYVYICDDTFSKRQILKMEIDILRKLEYNLGRPLPIHFLRRYSKIAGVKMEKHTLAKYILELALLDHNMSHIRPSLQAAAACCLSISILSDVTCPSKVWTATLVHYTTYNYSDFKDVMVRQSSILLNAETMKNQFIQTKYAASNLCKISTNPKLRGSLVRRLAQTSPK